MEEVKKTEETAAPAAPEAPKPEFSLKDFAPEARGEFMILSNIETFLKKVEGMKGDEAMAYAQARQYIVQRAQGIAEAEVARLRAAKFAASPESK